MGHILNSRLRDGNDPDIQHKKESVIKTLFSENMLNASGIRTLARNEKRFRPGAYHNGNVWLWDTYTISLGLERHGYNELSYELDKRIWNVVDKYRKFPEFARGGDEEEPVLTNRIVDVWDNRYHFKNRLEQPPQEIQAWTVAAMYAVKYKRGQLLKNTGSMHTQTKGEPRQLEHEILMSLDPEIRGIANRK
jgi:glycogen debranching enzyme